MTNFQQAYNYSNLIFTLRTASKSDGTTIDELQRSQPLQSKKYAVLPSSVEQAIVTDHYRHQSNALGQLNHLHHLLFSPQYKNP